MNLNIKTIKNDEEIVEFVAGSINRQLEKGKKVLWFISGGSSIPAEVLIAKKINEKYSSNLVVTLTDERYGLLGHLDSNWQKLKTSGFKIREAKLIPILVGKDSKTTLEKFKEILKKELDKAEYKIGLFGLGIDGHTAGIFPHSEALKTDEQVCIYDTELYNRITITEKVIVMLDEVVVYAVDKKKKVMIENLEKDLSKDDMPAQILKKVPLLTIFTDYNVYEKK